MSKQTGRTPLPEQKAYHYNPVPKRASVYAPNTEEPEASHQRAGHYAGIHPEDAPCTTASKAPSPLSLPRTQPPLVDEYDDEVYALPRSSSSVRRYPAPLPSRPARAKQGSSRGILALLAGACVLAGITGALTIPPLWTRGMDQLHYGMPRTSQVDANVGHGTKKNPTTHFIALNNHGYVEVIELPTGVPNAESLHLYLLAQPYSAESDQAPVTVEFADVNGDGKVDMVVSCNNNRFILYNDGHTFKEKP